MLSARVGDSFCATIVCRRKTRFMFILLSYVVFCMDKRKQSRLSLCPKFTAPMSYRTPVELPVAITGFYLLESKRNDTRSPVELPGMFFYGNRASSAGPYSVFSIENKLIRWPIKTQMHLGKLNTTHDSLALDEHMRIAYNEKPYVTSYQSLLISSARR